MRGRQTSAHQAGVTGAQHSFAMVPSAPIQRSVFDRSCGLKTAFDAGYLVPIFVDEALPGDTFSMRAQSLVRMATPLFPLMDNLYLDLFFFAVPNRLVWENWQKFNGEQANPGDSTDFLVPILDTYTVLPDTVYDYMGLPVGKDLGPTAPDIPCTVLHLRAMNLIWNEWFRDQNLQDSLEVPIDDGPDAPATYTLLRRGKRHDYFTSSLPFPQKGDAVTLPLGTTAPVERVANAPAWISFDEGAETHLGATQTISALTVTGEVFKTVIGATGGGISMDPVGGLVANLSSATAATINSIREAFQIQRLLERDARGGTRYTEIIRAHFGVLSPDARLQRPEYLGGGSQRIAFAPVAATSYDDGAAGYALGTLGAYAVTGTQSSWFKSFSEHCVILGFANVRADLTYQQGLNRMWSRRTRYDFYWPALAHLGEQAVLNKEIFAQGTAADLLVWGYQERYAEYRYKPSMTTSTMRSTHATPLDQWHLGIEFGSLPLLNDVFIVDDPPVDRVVANPAEKHFFGDFFFEFRCARPMPTFSVPGLVDHF